MTDSCSPGTDPIARAARAALAVPQPALEAAIAAALREVIATAETELGNRLVSLALWGSLSRGEGRWEWRGGDPHLLSDLDIYVLVRPGTPRAAQFGRELGEAMARRGMDLEVYVRPAWQVRFRGRPTVLAELRQSGLLLAGAPLTRFVPEPPQCRFHVGQGCRRLYSFARKAVVAAAARSPHLAATPVEAAKLASVTADFLTMSRGEYYPRLADKVTRGAEIAVQGLALPPAAAQALLQAPAALRVVRPGHADAGRYWSQVQQALVAVLQAVLLPGREGATLADLAPLMRRRARRAYGGGLRRPVSALRFRRGLRRGARFRLCAHEDALDAALLLLGCLGDESEARSASGAAAYLRRAGVPVPDLPDREGALYGVEAIARLDALGAL